MGSGVLVLLDTHALIWLDQDTAALGNTARHRVDEALKVGELVVSAISFWETAMLVAKGRIEMTLPPAAWRRELLSWGLGEIPVDGAIGIAAAHLRDFHGDPADRGYGADRGRRADYRGSTGIGLAWQGRTVRCAAVIILTGSARRSLKTAPIPGTAVRRGARACGPIPRSDAGWGWPCRDSTSRPGRRPA